MNLLIRTLIVALVSFPAVALPPPEVSVVNLYDSKSRIPGALIPFKVQGVAMTNGHLLGVDVTTPTDGTCKTMIDPFTPSIFFLKCSTETSAQVKVRVLSDSTIYEVSLGPIAIVAPFSNVVPVDPRPTVDPNVIAGSQLFGAHCVRCHTPQIKAGRTASQIQAATLVIDDMKPLAGVLTPSDYTKLEAFLRSVR